VRSTVVALAGLAVGLLVAAPASTTVEAVPVTITSATHVDGYASVTWTAPPPGWFTMVVQIATKPDVDATGGFLTDNFVDGGLAMGKTEFRSEKQLGPGTHYVHVYAHNSDLTQAGWTDIATFTVAPPPPVLENRRPTIGGVRWARVGHDRAGPRYYVTVTARFRLCDDSAGAVTLRRTERKWLGSRTSATATATTVRKLNGPCLATTWTWRVAPRFFGVGNYTVRLWATDARGARSTVATRTWSTRD
jgi:hypothetical protein